MNGKPASQSQKHQKEQCKIENMIPTVAAAAVGMAIGGAAVYAATQDHRQIRRTVHRLSRGAEKALIDFDRMVESYTK